MQARRHREGGRRNRRSSLLRLKHCLSHLFHEKGNAIGTLDDVLADTCRQELVANNTVDNRADFTLRQSIDCQGGYMRASDPRRLEFRSEGHDQQHAKCPNPVHHPPE